MDEPPVSDATRPTAEADLPFKLRRDAEAYSTTDCRHQLLLRAAAAIDALRADLARAEAERDAAIARAERAEESVGDYESVYKDWEEANADAATLAAEVRIAREPVTDTNHHGRWRRLKIAMTETDASGALTRHSPRADAKGAKR